MNEDRLREILDNFIKHVRNDGDGGAGERQTFADYLKDYFDDLESEDYFGTEGQSHPFGDKRN